MKLLKKSRQKEKLIKNVIKNHWRRFNYTGKNKIKHKNKNKLEFTYWGGYDDEVSVSGISTAGSSDNKKEQK